MTTLVQPRGWSQAELAAVRDFAGERRYDLVWAPDIDPAETNRFNRLPQPVYYTALRDLLAAPARAAFYERYPYAITPPTDDRPFFFHFFKWEQTPALLAALGKTWQPFGGSGYFVLLALLALVVLLSALFILAPLLARRPAQPPASAVAPERPPGRRRVLLYFTALGLAFLFVEIPLIQHWILLLGNATYAFSLVVAVLLSFSGLGSGLARAAWLPRRAAFSLLIVLALLTPWLAARLSGAILGWPLALRILLGGLSLAPLAFLMGLPFPLGLAWLERRAPGLVPWAWAVNGCASVVASVLAAMLALSGGFTAVLLIGAGAYLLAFLVIGRARAGI
jgi:hypothetical protein